MLTAVRRTGRRMGRVGKQLQMGEEKGKRLRWGREEGGGGARGGRQGGGEGSGGEGEGRGERGKDGDDRHLLVLSCVQPFATPWTAACQAPPSIEFSR